MKDRALYDYLIIGQGIAGSVLAITLIKKGKKVLVIDDDHRTSASVVAAGLVNPVALKRMVPSWRADQLLPSAMKFYREAEKLLNAETFYHEREIIKPFSGEEEIGQWKGNAGKPVGKYLSQEIIPSFHSEYYLNPLGCGVIKQAANLSTGSFLKATREFLEANISLLADKFSFDELQVTDGAVTYKKYKASKIIFCEGFRAIYNPYFSWLPFRLTKGELIEVTIPGLETEKVVNKGVFVLQKEGDSYRVGATYQWNNIDPAPSKEARQELCTKLEKIMHHHYEVNDHWAGIRPTVKDHRPFIGPNPEQSSVYIFNGLGSKGVMMAPYFAAHLTDHLENNISLDPEVDIARHYDEYRKIDQ